MNSFQDSKLVVCSVMVKPVRAFVMDKVLTWFDQIVRVPMHTFVVEESKIPLDQNNVDGYWYCAGDFCNIDEAGVYQYIDEANVVFAKCLVAPNIKDDDPNRPSKVIQGEYGVHYVCHNIANRVLFAAKSSPTLGNIDIPKTGYSVVVKSVLGVYGQNKVEWERRKYACKYGPGDKNDNLNFSPSSDFQIERELEIEKIHLVACEGNKKKSGNLTFALRDIDERFLQSTSEAIEVYNSKSIDFELFNRKMLHACSVLFSQTIDTVGLEMTKKIYPSCELFIKVNDVLEPPKKYMGAGG